MEQAFNELSRIDGREMVRHAEIYSLGSDRQVLKTMFVENLLRFDNNINEESLQFLPEYEIVLDWMINNQGKGLFITGDVGRGKTNIIIGVIRPLFLAQMNKLIIGCHARDLPGQVESFKKRAIVYVDELGTESMANYFGERFEAFNVLLDVVEQYNKPMLIISSNLSGEAFQKRYGDRSLDRLQRLCKIISFKGVSLRPNN